MPASISAASISGESEAGPMVQTILVRRKIIMAVLLSPNEHKPKSLTTKDKRKIPEMQAGKKMPEYKILPLVIGAGAAHLFWLFRFLSFLPFHGQYRGSWLHACSSGFKRSL
jgi:hypothetical protein